jgi:hypothetical protein
VPSTPTSQAKELWDVVQAARSGTKYWVRVLKFGDTGYPWSLHECALMTRDGLRELGFKAYFDDERVDVNAGWPTPEDRARLGIERQIIIGGNIGTARAYASIPDGSIVYNFEQAGASQFGAHYLSLLKRCVVWEYHPDNIKYLKSLYGINAILVPFGYISAFTPPAPEIPPAMEYDVAFVGSLNPQRKIIINELELVGLKVFASQECQWDKRPDVYRRSKVVLNMHYYPKVKVMEVVRIGLALAMSKAVVTQIDPDTRVDPYYLPGVAAAPYKELAATVKRIVNDPVERRRLEKDGFELFISRQAKDSLRGALDHEPTPPTQRLPESHERTPNASGTVYRRVSRTGQVR